LLLVVGCPWDGCAYVLTFPDDPVPNIRDRLSGCANMVADWLESPQMLPASTLMANISTQWKNHSHWTMIENKMKEIMLTVDMDLNTFKNVPTYHRDIFGRRTSLLNPEECTEVATALMEYKDVASTGVLTNPSIMQKKSSFQTLWTKIMALSDSMHQSSHPPSLLLHRVELTSIKLLLYQVVNIDHHWSDWSEELQKIDIQSDIAGVEGGLEQLLEYSRSKIECRLQLGRAIDSYKMTDHVSGKERLCHQKHVREDRVLAEGSCQNSCQAFQDQMMQGVAFKLWQPVLYPLKKWKIWISNKEAKGIYVAATTNTPGNGTGPAFSITNGTDDTASYYDGTDYNYDISYDSQGFQNFFK